MGGGRAPLLRPRLLRAMNGPARAVVVCGPRGYGKSTLIGQWIEAAQERMVRLPEGALGASTERFADLLASALPPGCGRPGAGGEAVSSMVERSGGALTVIVDHQQHAVSVGADSTLAGVLAAVPGLRLVVVSRICPDGDPPSDGSVRIIGAAELAFTRTELQEYMRGHGVALAHESAEAVVGYLGGVPGFVGLAVPAIRSLATAVRWAGEGSRVEIDPEATHWRAVEAGLGRWVDTALTRLPRADLTAGLLTLVALLGSVPEDTARAVLRCEDASMLRERANRLGLPRWEAGGRTGWRPAPVVQRALQRRYRAGRLPGAEKVRAALAEDLSSAGDFATLLRSAIAAEDWDQGIGVLRTRLSVLLRTDMQAVRMFLEALPPEVAQRDPMMEQGRAMFAALEAGTASSAPELIVSDGPLEQLHGGDLHSVVYGGTARAVLLRLAGRFADAAALAHEVAAVVDTSGPADCEQLAGVLPAFRGQWAITHQLAADLESAEEQFRVSFAGARAEGLDTAAKNAAGTLAMNDAFRGEVVRARHWLTVERRIGDPGGWLSERVRIPGQVAEVLIALDLLDLPGAAEAAEVLGMPGDTEEFWGPMIGARAILLLFDGRAREGLDLIERARRQFARWEPAGSYAHELLTLLRADLHLALGAGPEALAAIEEMEQERPSVRVRAARVQLLQDDPHSVLATVGDCTDAAFWSRSFIEMLLLSAAAHTLIGAGDRARSELGRAIAAAQQAGSVRPLVMLPRAHRRRLVDAGSAGADLAAVWDAHDGMDLFPPQRTPVPSLTSRERAVLSLVAQGRGRRQVAEALFVSENTVKSQLRSIYRKLGVGGRDAAIEAARSMRLL